VADDVAFKELAGWILEAFSTVCGDIIARGEVGTRATKPSVE
jgi:hypothetical protein